MELFGGDKCGDQVKQLLFGLGRRAFNQLDAPFQTLVNDGLSYLAASVHAQQFIGGDDEAACQVDEQVGGRALELGLVVGDLTTAGADHIGESALGIASVLALLGEVSVEASGVSDGALGRMGGSTMKPLRRVSAVLAHAARPCSVCSRQCTTIVQSAVTPFENPREARAGVHFRKVGPALTPSVSSRHKVVADDACPTVGTSTLTGRGLQTFRA